MFMASFYRCLSFHTGRGIGEFSFRILYLTLPVFKKVFFSAWIDYFHYLKSICQMLDVFPFLEQCPSIINDDGIDL